MRFYIAFFLLLFSAKTVAGPLYDHVFRIQDEFTDIGSPSELAIQFLQEKALQEKLTLAECFMIVDDILLYVRLNPRSLRSSDERVANFYANQKIFCENIKNEVIKTPDQNPSKTPQEIVTETLVLVKKMITMMESNVCYFARESCFERTLIEKINNLEIECQLCKKYCPKLLTDTIEHKTIQIMYNYINEIKYQVVQVMFPESPEINSPELLANIDDLIRAFEMDVLQLPNYQTKYAMTCRGLLMRLRSYRGTIAGVPQLSINNYTYLMLDICAFLDGVLVDLKSKRPIQASHSEDDDDDLDGFQIID